MNQKDKKELIDIIEMLLAICDIAEIETATALVNRAYEIIERDNRA